MLKTCCAEIDPASSVASCNEARQQGARSQPPILLCTFLGLCALHGRKPSQNELLHLSRELHLLVTGTRANVWPRSRMAIRISTHSCAYRYAPNWQWKDRDRFDNLFHDTWCWDVVWMDRQALTRHRSWRRSCQVSGTDVPRI